MHVYVVLLLSANQSVAEKIQSVYPQNFKYNDTTFFVADNRPVTENIAFDIGIKGENRIDDASGVVLKLGASPSYSGYTNRSLWDWLGAAGEQRTWH